MDCDDCGENLKVSESNDIVYPDRKGVVHLCDTCYNKLGTILNPDEQ